MPARRPLHCCLFPESRVDSLNPARLPTWVRLHGDLGVGRDAEFVVQRVQQLRQQRRRDERRRAAPEEHRCQGLQAQLEGSHPQWSRSKGPAGSALCDATALQVLHTRVGCGAVVQPAASVFQRPGARHLVGVFCVRRRIDFRQEEVGVVLHAALHGRLLQRGSHCHDWKVACATSLQAMKHGAARYAS